MFAKDLQANSEGLKADPIPNKAGDVSRLASVAWAMNEGDLNPGAADVTIGFSDRAQSANLLIQDRGPRDLTGVMLLVRVKVTSGFSQDPSLPGGLTLLVYDQAFRRAAFTSSVQKLTLHIPRSMLVVAMAPPQTTQQVNTTPL